MESLDGVIPPEEIAFIAYNIGIRAKIWRINYKWKDHWTQWRIESSRVTLTITLCMMRTWSPDS